MSGNDNYDLLGKSVLTDLAADDELLNEYAKYQEAASSPAAINLSVDPNAQPEPEQKKQVAKKVQSKKKAKEQSEFMNKVLVCVIPAIVVFVVFCAMLFPKTAGIFSVLGPIDATKGIAFRGLTLGIISMLVAFGVAYLV